MFVLFSKKFESNRVNQLEQTSTSIATPTRFNCPISHEMMRVPVRFADLRHNFELGPLQEWYSNHNTNPLTGEEEHDGFKLNLLLRNEIHFFVSQLKLYDQEIKKLQSQLNQLLDKQNQTEEEIRLYTSVRNEIESLYKHREKFIKIMSEKEDLREQRQSASSPVSRLDELASQLDQLLAEQEQNNTQTKEEAFKIMKLITKIKKLQKKIADEYSTLEESNEENHFSYRS